MKNSAKLIKSIIARSSMSKIVYWGGQLSGFNKDEFDKLIFDSTGFLKSRNEINDTKLFKIIKSDLILRRILEDEANSLIESIAEEALRKRTRSKGRN